MKYITVEEINNYHEIIRHFNLHGPQWYIPYTYQTYNTHWFNPNPYKISETRDITETYIVKEVI